MNNAAGKYLNVFFDVQQRFIVSVIRQPADKHRLTPSLRGVENKNLGMNKEQTIGNASITWHTELITKGGTVDYVTVNVCVADGHTHYWCQVKTHQKHRAFVEFLLSSFPPVCSGLSWVELVLSVLTVVFEDADGGAREPRPQRQRGVVQLITQNQTALEITNQFTEGIFIQHIQTCPLQSDGGHSMA